MHNFILYVSTILTAAALSACIAPTSSARFDYATVADNPSRDAERARQLNAKAAQLIKQQKYDQAERMLKNALTADISFGPAHNNLGKVYYHQSRYYLAAWEFQYAIKLMPHQPAPRNNLGLVFEHVGKLDDAVDAYQQALDLEPDNPHLLGNTARARLKRGDKGPDVRDLLSELTLKDTRPDWLKWARQKLALMPPPGTD